jgi:hypothetical protein
MTIRQRQSQNTLYQQIMRRIRLVLIGLFVLTSVGSVYLVISNGLRSVETARQSGLLAVANAIESELGDAVAEMVSLSSGVFARDYNTFANEVLISGSSLSAFQNTQSNLLRVFNDFIARHPDRYAAVRFLTRENQVWGEATNLRGLVTLNPDLRRMTSQETQAVYRDLLDEQRLSGIYFSDILINMEGIPFAYVYLPIAQTGNLQLQGLIQFELLIPSLLQGTEDIRNNALYNVPGREMTIIDRNGNILFDTNEEARLSSYLITVTIANINNPLTSFFFENSCIRHVLSRPIQGF